MGAPEVSVRASEACARLPLQTQSRRVVMRRMLLGKIHRATVTQADLHYEGSVTVDDSLLHGAGILEHEQVDIWNVTRGTRLTTYALRGPAGSGVVCINGAAAHLVDPGDVVIIAAFADFTPEEATAHRPRCVFVDAQNAIREIDSERAGPSLPRHLVA